MMHVDSDIKCLSKGLVSDLRFLMTLMYEISDIRYLASCLKAYRLSEWIFFYIKRCQCSMFYTNCS
jgi:hypothetical protein